MRYKQRVSRYGGGRALVCDILGVALLLGSVFGTGGMGPDGD